MRKIIFTITLLYTLVLSGCSSDEFYTMSFDDGTKQIFEVKDEHGDGIEGAYVVFFRKLQTIHVRVGEGYTNKDGGIRIIDKTNSTKGYASIVAPGFNSKKVMLEINPKETNTVTVTLDKQNVIKIMSYNIEEGFKKNDKLKKDFAKWVQVYDPDVMVLQEMMHFPTEASFQEFAKSYGHDYAVITKTVGIPTGITSKKPIDNVKKVVDPLRLHHGYVYGETYGIKLFAIHLCPYAVDHERNKNKIDRLDEMKIILDDAAQHKGDPVIIAGDFNSHNQFDRDSFGPGYTSNNTDYRVTNLCKTSNYFDAYPLLNTQFKATYSTGQISVNGANKGYRLDYIMLNDKVKEKSVYSDIIQNVFADKTSDHYPVFIEVTK